MTSLDSPKRALIGKPPNHWLYNTSNMTFDLTRPLPPNFPEPLSDASISIVTTTKTILVSPPKTALIIIDMQKIFLSTQLGRSANGSGNKAAESLLETAIPAARRAGIQIIWLNWGLTESEIEEMPPSARRSFGFEASLESNKVKHFEESSYGNPKELTENGKPKRLYKGLGTEIGPVTIDDGKIIEAGRLLMRDTWNASLSPLLEAVYKEGQLLKLKPDVWIHKNRMSGLWGERTPCSEFLDMKGISTLLFAGVNTDQCVSGTLQDAFSKGWDCILLKDACGTTSPGFATDCVEYNCVKSWGFVTVCSALEQELRIFDISRFNDAMLMMQCLHGDILQRPSKVLIDRLACFPRPDRPLLHHEDPFEPYDGIYKVR